MSRGWSASGFEERDRRGYPSRGRRATLVVTLSVLVVPPVFAAAAGAKAPRLSPQEKADAEAAGLDAKKLSALRAEIEGFVASGEIAGAVALLGRRGRIGTVQAVGLADVRARTPMRASTLFRLEGMTRVATATAVLMLRDEGALSLDDEVTKHLPGFCGQQVLATDVAAPRQPDPARPMMISDLLRETSGLSCAGEPPGDDRRSAAKPGGRAKPPRTLAAAVDAIARRPLLRAPGVQTESCDANYLVLGRIIEVVARQKFEAFMQKRLFAPLRMTGARFRTGGGERRRLARVHEDVDAGPATKLGPAAPTVVDDFPNPARGLIATAADHARLLQLLLDGGMARGRRFLQPETVAEMLTPVSTLLDGQPGVRPAVGLEVVRSPSAETTPLSPGSFGSSGRLGTHGWVDPANDAVFVVFTQQRNAGGVTGKLPGQAVRAAFQSLGADAIVRRSTEPKPGLFSDRRGPRKR